jgi:uncharacterized protein
MPLDSTQAHFNEALAALVEDIKKDKSILAAILCGSLSHDTVWNKSDIDLALITIDDAKIKGGEAALYAEGVNVHAFMLSRTDLRKTVEAALRSSFVHSLLAKGKLLYTHDPTIERMLEGLERIGERDTTVLMLHAGTGALPLVYKAHKFMLTRGDLEYTSLWLLYAASALARIEVVFARQLLEREVIQQALKLNPTFFGTIYTDLLNERKTKERVQAALDAVDAYILERAPIMFAPILDHLREVREARSCTEIADHFKRNFGVSDVMTACEYLADQGMIGKAGAPVKLTKRSDVQLQELAFYHLGGPEETW